MPLGRRELSELQVGEVAPAGFDDIRHEVPEFGGSEAELATGLALLVLLGHREAAVGEASQDHLIGDDHLGGVDDEVREQVRVGFDLLEEVVGRARREGEDELLRPLRVAHLDLAGLAVHAQLNAVAAVGTALAALEPHIHHDAGDSLDHAVPFDVWRHNHCDTPKNSISHYVCSEDRFCLISVVKFTIFS